MKSENILFSIIVPAYNSALFINKCIDSVLRQTCPNWELILVDDGSIDNTLSICNTYAEVDSRIKVIHKENGGHTSARNEGLKCSVGEYVLFLDSDDWISNQTLEICMSEIVINDSDIVIYRMQNSNSRLPFSVLLADGCYNVRDLEKNGRNSFILAKEGNFIFPKSLSGKCFKRDIIYENQIRVPKEVLVGEDGAAFVGAILSSERISVVSNNINACYNCLVRSGSVSRSADADAFMKATALLKHYDRILRTTSTDYFSQFYRDVIAQLYTATLLVIRSGGKSVQLNKGLNSAINNPVIKTALNEAKFSLKGYKFIIKKFILRYRLWGLAMLLDR